MKVDAIVSLVFLAIGAYLVLNNANAANTIIQSGSAAVNNSIALLQGRGGNNTLPQYSFPSNNLFGL